MSKRHDALVFIGRFSPLHLGHEAVIDKAISLGPVIVLVGSAFGPRNLRNPWTFEERKAMIKAKYGDRVIVKPLPDYPYNDQKWKAAVRSLVYSSLPWSDMPQKIGLIGHSKDRSSYYLNMFPDWDSIEVENHEGLNATTIRELLLHRRDISQFLSEDVANEIAPLPETIFNEFELNNLYQKPYRTLTRKDIENWYGAMDEEDFIVVDHIEDFADEFRPKYPPIFHTVDAVVVQSGHVLLVKRKSAPGIGLWALPGGFLEQDETMVAGAVRELREETKIKVPEPVLYGSIKGEKVFDHPHRSTRGRTITTAFFFDLGDKATLPKVVGSDDAEKAVWVPYNEIDMTKMFEDHGHIIDYFTNIK